MARRARYLAAMFLAVLAGGAAHAQSQQDRTVTGRVNDVDTGEPLVGAQITVRGLIGRGTVARDDGTFSLQVPAQDVVLHIRRIGYPMREVPVPVGTDDVTVTLRKDVLKLEQVVVTGPASGISRRNLANSVASVDAEDLTRVPAISLEQALQGKIAGAQIQSNTGAPGGGNRIRIRGISSILGNSQPLYVVDGVIASDVAIAPGTNRITKASGSVTIAVPSQENPVNRIADLNPDDIEGIEVLKGSAAAAIYGSKASGGVVMITTKRGRAGRPQFTVRQGIGTARLAYKEGSRRFQSLAAARAAFDPNNTRGDAFWATAYNPANNFSYEDLLFGEKPINYETSFSVSGGNEVTRYFVSALLRRDEGIVKNTFADKKSLRINLDQNFGSRVTLSAGSELVRNAADRGLFGNDNAGNSIYYTVTKLPSFYDFRPSGGTYPVNPFYASNPFQTIDMLQNRETVWRSLSNARVQFEALNGATHQLRFIAMGGVDVFTQRNNVFSPPELHYEDDDGRLGAAIASYAQNLQYNANLNAVHVFTPQTWLSFTSQLGTQYEVRDLDQTRTAGENLLGGLAIPDAGTVRDLDIDQLKVNDFGYFAQTEALAWEKLLVTVGMRADRSSNNGDVAKFYFFPKYAASYRMPGLMPGMIDELKVRAAYGTTGNQPQYGQKFTNLTSGSIGGLGGFSLGATRGFADIRPELQRELEGGIDASLFGNRAQLELTGFERNISDLLIQRTLAPTTGFSQEVYNAASMRVRGFEASLNAFPVQTQALGGISWNVRINFGMNRSKVTKLPVPAFLISTPQVGAIQIKEGQSATRLVGNDTVGVAGTCPPHPVDPSVCSTRVVGNVVPVYMGDASPDYTGGIGNEVRWKGLSLYAMLDRQKGGMLAAGTWRHFDLGQNSRDYDASGPDPAKTLGKWRTDTYLKVTRIYYQDISYWKLRELTLTYDVPQQFLSRVGGGARSARVSLSGRNLKWWTEFRGGDPDFANFGGTPESVQRNRELAAYPASRQFWANVQVGF
jgi:TonB-linked SusC/RagA family outer membrane protein